MGGIVLRDFAKEYDTRKILGALTLAAPHQGSAIVDSLAFIQAHYLLGPTGYSLRSKELSEADSKLDFPVETVAGQAEWVPYLPFGFFLGKESDGIVKGINSRLKGVKHHQVNASHTFIMNHEKVMNLIEEKLKNSLD